MRFSILPTVFLLLFVLVHFAPNTAYAQFPHDSLFAPGKAIVTFRPSAINRLYFCGHAIQGGKGASAKVLSPTPIQPSHLLIRDTATVLFLQNNNVELEPMWTCKSPCTDSVEINPWNDTLHFPYWTSYILHYPDTVSPVLLTTMLQLSHPKAVLRTYPIPFRQIYQQDAVPNDPKYNEQLSLHPLFIDTDLIPPNTSNYAVDVEGAWDYTTGSSNVGMAVFDGRMDPLNNLHRDFYHYPGGSGPAQTNVVSSKEYFSSGTGRDIWHGRVAALIMSALRNNKNSTNTYEGIAGIAGGNLDNGNVGCRLYLAGVLGEYPQNSQVPDLWRNWPEIPIGTALDEITGLDSECGDCVRIVNMSIGTDMVGGGQPMLDYPGSPGEYIKYAQAYRRGVILVNANGNSNFPNVDATPEDNGWKYRLPGGFNDQWFIGVGGNKKTGERHPKSVYGGSMRLLAPGSSDNQSEYQVYSGGSGLTDYNYLTYGSSWAAPHVAATAGLILSRVPELFNDDVAGVMEGTTNWAVGQTARFEKEFGFGILDAAEAVRYATGVRHGVFKFSDLTEKERSEIIENMVANAYLDAEFTSDVFVQGAESTDPYEYQQGDKWMRYELRITVTLPPSVPGQLKHVWGIGQGDGAIYTTTGWEKGVVAARTLESLPVVEAIWCSETPYAKVDPASIDEINRSFDIITYFYDNYQESRTYPINIYDSNELSKIQLAYGFLLENVTSIGADVVPPTALAIEHIAPNPVRDEARLRFNTSRNSSVAIEVVDYLGRRVLAFPLGVLPAGTHETLLHLTSVPAGAYICRVADSTTGEYITQSFIVEK